MLSCLPDALHTASPGRCIALLWKTAAVWQQFNDDHLLMLSCLPDAPARDLLREAATNSFNGEALGVKLFDYGNCIRCAACSILRQIHRFALEDSRCLAAVQ